MQRFFSYVGCLVIAGILMGGCALTKDAVSISYDPQKDVAKIEGAEEVNVSVEVTDIRAIKDKVSAKKNGYGMEMAPIVAENDVAKVFEQAIKTELKARGFNSGDAVLVVAELQKFYSDFKIGFWSGTAAAEATMNIQVKKKDGSTVFSKLVSAEGSNPGCMLASGENAKIALEDSLKSSVAKLFNDKTFYEAIFLAKMNLTRRQ